MTRVTPPPPRIRHTGSQVLDLAHDDVFFSPAGALGERRCVFLHGAGVTSRWHARASFTIAELGFGAGINCLLALDAFLRSCSPPQCLHFIAFEKSPMTRAQIASIQRFVLRGDTPELLAAHHLLMAQYRSLAHGVHRLKLAENFLLTLFIGPGEKWLPQTAFRADVWYLDGFAPHKNPALWTENVAQHILRCTAPQGIVASYSTHPGVLDTLHKVGFNCTKKPGFPPKKYRLLAYPCKNVAPAVGTRRLHTPMQSTQEHPCRKRSPSPSSAAE